MAGKNQVTLTFAGDSEQLTKSFDKVGTAAKGMEDNVGKASKKVAESADGFDKAGQAADGTYSKFDALESVGRGTTDTMSGLGEIMKGNVLQGSTDLAGGVAALADGFAGALLPALKAGVTGFKAAASAAKAFTLSLLTNPVFLIGAAIAALVVGLVILYKKSDTARDIMNTAFSAIGRTAILMGKVAIQSFQFLVNAALTAAEKVIGAAAKIPGPQQKSLQKAAQSIKEFKESANGSFDKAIGKLNQWDTTLKNLPKVAKLQGNITDLEAKIKAAKEKLGDPKLTATQRAQLTANIGNLQRQVNAAKTKLNEIKNKNVTLTVTLDAIVTKQYANVISGKYDYFGKPIPGRAGGGPVKAGMPYVVGERGPELMIPNDSGTIVPNGAMGGRTEVVIRIEGRGDLVELLRKSIQARGAGGDPVKVLRTA